MSPIFQALNVGYSPEKILKYLSQNNPQLAKKISMALNVGHTFDHVLNFISKNEKKRIGKLIPEKASNQPQQSQNLYKQAQSNIHPSLIGMAKVAGNTAAAVGGAYALSRVVPQLGIASQQLQKGLGLTGQNPASLPSSNQAPNPISNQQIPPQGMPNELSQQPPSLNTPSNITQAPNIQQPEVNNIQSPADVLWNSLLQGKSKGPDQETSALLKIAKKMQTTGEIKSKEDFDKLYSLFQEKKSQGMNLPKALKEASNEFDKQKLTQEPIQEPEAIAKNETVATPHGLGEVKEVRGDKALIDVDGKLHKIDLEELIESPLPEKDLADLYDDMISGIEKQTGKQVSRNVEYAGYDPETNELVYRPHGSRVYVYDDISEKDKEELTNLLSQRKSTGQNFIGAWEAGSESPIGAAMFKLIQRLQKERGGKGNEYKNRFETLYDALEPARTASKERYARLKKKKKT